MKRGLGKKPGGEEKKKLKRKENVLQKAYLLLSYLLLLSLLKAFWATPALGWGGSTAPRQTWRQACCKHARERAKESEVRMEKDSEEAE